jgi:hypothetical protein
MDKGSCPVMAANYPACGCAEGECEVFDEFGMACDNCDRAGHRETDGWRLNADGSVWCQQCAEVLPPPPQTNMVGGEGTCLAGEQRGTDDRLNRSHIGNDHDSLAALVGNIDGHREGVAGLKQDPSQFLLQTLDGFCTDLLNTCTLGSDIVNALPAVEIVEEVEGQDQAPSFERADQSLVEPHGKAHEIANIAPSATADKPSNPFGQKRTVPAPETNVTGPSDAELLDVLASNSWDLRCISVPTGGDDADIDWIIIEHHQAEPQERTIAQAYADDPRAAIRRAIRETDKNAARCVSCDEVLHDGDRVYYEHGEGGHIHSHCASEDPEGYVDEDEVPLKAGDEIPKPFTYSVEKYEGRP